MLNSFLFSLVVRFWPFLPRSVLFSALFPQSSGFASYLALATRHRHVDEPPGVRQPLLCPALGCLRLLSLLDLRSLRLDLACDDSTTC